MPAKCLRCQIYLSGAQWRAGLEFKRQWAEEDSDLRGRVLGAGFRHSVFGIRYSGFRCHCFRRPKKRLVWSEKRLMNVEHRTSNIERRIMYSVYLIKRRSKAIPHFDILRFAFKFLCSFTRAEAAGRRRPVWSEKKLLQIKAVSIYSFAVSSSSSYSYSSSKLLSRFQTRGRGRGRGRFKYLALGL